MTRYSLVTVGKFARASLFTVLLAASCTGSVRSIRPPDQSDRGHRVLNLLWKRKLVTQPFFYYRPQEWASAAVATDGTVFIGASNGRFLRMSPEGDVVWNRDIKHVVSSRPLYDATTERVYFGADDGRLHALNAINGQSLWEYSTEGIITHAPALAGDILLFTSSENRVYGLDSHTGKWRWQYDRERVEGFTIHGYAGVAVAGGLLFTGFSDGLLVALKVTTGEVAWSRSLALADAMFVDVDATPAVVGDIVFCGGQSGGVYALRRDTGATVWHVDLEGVAHLTASQRSGLLFVASSKAGIVALDQKQGREVWRQATPGGTPLAPVVFGTYVLAGLSEGGLYIADQRSGELAQYIRPSSRGFSAAPALGTSRVVLLSNFGTLYTFAGNNAVGGGS